MANKPHIIHTVTPAGTGEGMATSHANRVNGGWLNVQAQEAIANMRVHRAFDDARDPLIAKHLKDADRGQTESERRGETDGGGQKHKRSDRITTQHGLRRKSDRLRKPGNPDPQKTGWLKEQARAAMQSIPQQISKPARDITPQPTPANKNPKHNRSRDGPQPPRPFHGPSM